MEQAPGVRDFFVGEFPDWLKKCTILHSIGPSARFRLELAGGPGHCESQAPPSPPLAAHRVTRVAPDPDSPLLRHRQVNLSKASLGAMKVDGWGTRKSSTTVCCPGRHKYLLNILLLHTMAE